MFKKNKARPLMILLLSVMLFCRQSDASADEGVVLALSGGGAKGLAHIGVIKVLQDEGVQIVGIVGTSMGAIIGGLTAAGYDGDELANIFQELDIYELFSDSRDGKTPSSQSKSIIRIGYDKEGRIVGRKGLMEGKGLYEEMLKYTAKAETYDFMKLPIPFAAVATDLETGDMVVITKGNLASAMRASMALPGIFSPWPYEGKLLIDGGMVANLPVRVAKELFPDYPVVAVDVTGKLVTKEEIRSIVDVLGQTVGIVTAKNVQEDLQYSDFVIRPSVDDISLMNFSNASRIIERGAVAAAQEIENIKLLAANKVDETYTSAEKPVVKNVILTGLPDIEKPFIAEKRWWIGRPLSMALVNEALLELLRHDRVATADYKLLEDDEEVTVEFVVQRKPPKEYKFYGYSTNLSPHNRWVSLEYTGRDVLDIGDQANLKLWLGENTLARASYMGQEGGAWRFESDLAFQDWEISPENSGKVDWKRSFLYLGFSKVDEDLLPFSGGFAFDYIDGDGSDHHWGPMVKLFYKNKSTDKSKRYFEAKGVLWYPEGETLLGHLDFYSSFSVGDKLSLNFSGGLEKGDASTPAWASYLGGHGELLSRYGHPIMADNTAWARVGLKSALIRGWFARFEPEFFGAVGYAMDDDWNSFDDIWEVGIRLNIPNRLIDLNVFALYDDRSDWTFGFSVGMPPLSLEPVMP